jgi:hypothetical protein
MKRDVIADKLAKTFGVNFPRVQDQLAKSFELLFGFFREGFGRPAIGIGVVEEIHRGFGTGRY